MDFETSQTLGVNVTYGWRVAEVKSGGPAGNAGVNVNDVIVAINATRIRSTDEMSSYLEENTLPGQTVILGIVRGNQTLTLSLVLGKRPPAPA
jgi:S1-C subfamily serine protease